MTKPLEDWELDERHQRNTFIVGSIITALIAVWEFWTIISKAFGDTFSAVVYALGRKQTAIPFGMCFLQGHLWGRNKFTCTAAIVGFVCGAIFWPLMDEARAKVERAVEDARDAAEDAAHA